jgi:hypothetical protein
LSGGEFHMSILSSLFGTKPTVPTVPVLNLGTEQALAAQNNLNITPQATALSNATQAQVMALINSVDPSYNSQSSQIQSTISQELQGQIPADVSAQIQTSDAAKALTGGFSGSNMQGNLVARDLGLTSLSITQQGISSAESWMQMAEQLTSPAVSAFQSMFISPAQQASFDVQQQQTQTEEQWLAAQVAAMPDPEDVGIAATFTAGAPYWLGGYRPGQGGPTSGPSGGSSTATGNGMSLGDYGQVTGDSSSFSSGMPGSAGTVSSDGTGGSSAAGASTFINNIEGGGAAGTSGNSNTGLLGSLAAFL